MVGKRAASAALALAVMLCAGTSAACVGDACIQIWSTAAGGGALTLRYDFTQKVQTFESFCLPDRSECLYNTIDPGFMAETEELHSGFYPLVDETSVRVEIVSADPGLTMSVNGQKLNRPGQSAKLGTMPTIHNHPAWQLLLPGDEVGDFQVSYKLTTDSGLYSESEVFTSVVTNVEPPPVSATATPSPTPRAPCDGDCDDDGEITVDELIHGVGMALGTTEMDSCLSLDADRNGTISITELVRAVNAALNGCIPTEPVTFTEIQDTIFTPKCAIPTCHDSVSANANLVLVEGHAYDELVEVVPDTDPAAAAGLLLVAPGEPARSFLLLKVQGPPLGQGGRMPLTGDPLTAEEIDLIRNWILQGAHP